MPQTNLDIAELRRLVDAMTPGKWSADNGYVGADYARFLRRGVGDGVRLGGASNSPDIDGIVAIRNAAPAMLDEIERLRKVAEAAREFLDAYDIGHEEEHMFVNALRKALGGKDGK